MGEAGHHEKDSGLLKNGFAYKPGLFALIRLGEQVEAKSPVLISALAVAKTQLADEPVQEKPMCDSIRMLRAAIRDQKGTDESAHPALNRFPTDPLF